MTKLLLVEDDHSLGYILKEYLELNDYYVCLARDGQIGLEKFKEEDFDLCILDVMMPKMNGFVLAQHIREMDEAVPIIFLTSKALKVDKLKGFKIGADDYIVKPIDDEELIARIEVILKRVRRSTKAPAAEPLLFTIGSYRFDYDNQLLTHPDQEYRLTEREANLLRLLCEHKNQVLDRKNALNSLWGKSDYFTRRSMDVFVSRLRKYLQNDPSIKITAIHGKGYILSD